MASAGCVLTDGQPATRTIPPLTTAAARNGTALDRSGSITQCRAAIGPGATRQRLACGVVDVDARVAQHRHRHRHMRRRRHRLAGVHDRQPVGERRAGQQQPGDELRRARGVDLDGAAGHRSATAHRERQAVAVDVHAEPAQCVQQRRDRAGAGLFVAVEHHRLGADSAATGGTNRSTVPARPQSTVASGGRVDSAADRQLGVVAVDGDAEGAKRTDHQIGVPAAQRAADRRVPCARGQRGEHERPIGLRLRSGHRHRGVHRARRRRRLPVPPVTAPILPCRSFLPPWAVCVGDSR